MNTYTVNGITYYYYSSERKVRQKVITAKNYTYLYNIAGQYCGCVAPSGEKYDTPCEPCLVKSCCQILPYAWCDHIGFWKV